VNNIPSHLKKERKYLSYSLDGHLQMDRSDYLFSIEALLSGKEYGIELFDDPWVVFKKNVENIKLQDEVIKKIEQLKKQWQI